MGRHQDSEESVVGAVIASLPLGGDAMMEFDIANEFLTGWGRKGYTTELIPGCLKEAEKKKLLDSRASEELTEEDFTAQWRDLVNSCRAPRDHKSIVEFPIPGTERIMIQQGKKLNQHYIHVVESKGFARFISTGRNLRSKISETPLLPQKRYYYDLYLDRGSQRLQYQITGNVGTRQVTFEWFVSAFQHLSRYYHFSLTFSEAAPGDILALYCEIVEDGGAGGAYGTVGVQNTMVNKFLQYEDRTAGTVTNGTSVRYVTVNNVLTADHFDSSKTT
ncbi:Uu.00g123350.m01.CDS01 [Anthostomella pinea]|uniref:Uu.00g123350.m01.CDS01 n=1 Tax=Anthostomella pinea TaxID=933095 RepID=A0AAI8VHX0_9PEZI|nr:Uu.00g123350.m01.CDS01 [Anthostomella pinea]